MLPAIADMKLSCDVTWNKRFLETGGGGWVH